MLRLLKTVVTLYVVLCAAITGFAIVQDGREPAIFTPAEIIMVMGAGMDADGTLHLSTRQAKKWRSMRWS